MGSSASDRAGRTRAAAARALVKHTTLDARAIAESAMTIAADICIYTNANLDDRRAVAPHAHLPAGDDVGRRTSRSRPARSSPNSTSTSSASTTAKRAVAIALRNRMRRQKLAPDMADEVAPKNILMIGPTGVGKTEIARRLARLAQSPFLKVEASKFTEVGYVGRDVESMVRDLVELAVDMVREERLEEVRAKARRQRRGAPARSPAAAVAAGAPTRTRPRARDQANRDAREDRASSSATAGSTNARWRSTSASSSFPSFEIIAGSSVEEVGVNLKDMLPGLFQGRTKTRRVKVPEALEHLLQEEEQKLIDMESVAHAAVERVEQAGIIFVDEIDKIAGREGGHGPDVSREGVQRDILPIVEGTTVNTKYGMVRTDHILFIAAGAFHVSKPSDLIPELQGRFPIRVELEPLGRDEFVRILTEPKNALVKQYIALLETEGIDARVHRATRSSGSPTSRRS